ncbi:pentapeptide repeat-containing protein [Crossiella sp. CA-258035]|uniref:pentapeptide repeat-containing protein n=1 Tax=Crossiella sp. CA-258035 TaxID=2981138 RepID=UPI0024BD277E|nr:pentapeptide repeat-containing protein [Crossiella sp. CA-258035]WHT16810.1 pentapeptide repeat-containing protein [Crossiella sp. CA-258035]
MPSSPRRRRPRLTATSRIRRARPAARPAPPPAPAAPAAPPPLPPAPPARRAARGLLLPVAVLLVGLAALGTLWIASRSLAATEAQLTLTAQSQAAQRFTEAVGQLGSAKADIRLGAIYGLDSLIRDSAKDAARSVEVLTAFVRSRAPIEHCAGDTAQALQRPAEDVQAAITVIARRGSVSGDRLNLSRACLAGADLTQAHLDRADLTGTDLSRANLARARLRSADLSDGVLVQTDLTGADLRREEGADAWTTRLRQANLTGANLTSANLTGADLAGAELTSARLTGADLTGADLREATGVS